MANDKRTDLNVILGQLEDELQNIKSARDQVEEVISSNADLSANLERLFVSAKDVVQQSGEQTKGAAEALSKEVERISEHSEAIERAANEGVDTIRKQATEAQISLENAANIAVGHITTEATSLVEQSKAMELSSAETAETVRKQAEAAQATLEQVASSTVEKTSSELSELTGQAIAYLNEGLEKAKSDINLATESLDTALSSIKEESHTLLETHKEASEESRQQISESKVLLEETQTQLSEIDSRIATLKEIDIVGLVAELKELKDIEATNNAALQKRLTTAYIMVGVCIAACLAILLKLFIA